MCMGSKTLFNAVFNSPEQVVRFLLFVSGNDVLDNNNGPSGGVKFLKGKHMKRILFEARLVKNLFIT